MTVPRWAPPVAWAALVLAVNSIPGSDLPGSLERVDKLLHFAAYATLGVLTARALRATLPPFAAVSLAAAGGIAFGALDEWHQLFVPGRYPELVDWYADAGGALLGAIAPFLAGPQRQPT
ncbi:MAG TPA: VanZ family protein [Gemmatimonadaceae bacterium]|nr:VanZ family protein [Gemmatimonadaceae bacterium]